jgi:hypothetical protein
MSSSACVTISNRALTLGYGGQVGIKLPPIDRAIHRILDVRTDFGHADALSPRTGSLTFR